MASRYSTINKALGAKIEDSTITDGTVKDSIGELFDGLDYVFHLSNIHQQRLPVLSDVLKNSQEKMKGLLNTVGPRLETIKKTPSVLSEESAKEQKALNESLKYYKKMKVPLTELQYRITQSQRTHEHTTFLKNSEFKKGVDEKVCETQIKKFDGEFTSMVESVERFDYRGHTIKNMNNQDLEKEFERVNRSLKTLRESSDMYEDCLCSSAESGYSVDTLEKGLNHKYADLHGAAKDESTAIFSDMTYKSEDLISVYKNISSIFVNKRYRFVSDLEQVQEDNKVLDKDIEESYVKLREDCEQKREQSVQSHQEFLRFVDKENYRFPDEKDKIVKECQTKFEAKEQELTKKAQEQIDAEADEKAKENLQKNLKTDIDSCRIELNQQRDAAVEKLKQEFSQRRAEEESKMQAVVSVFVDQLTHYHKAKSDIISSSTSETKNFNKVLDKLDPSKMDSKEGKKETLRFMKVIIKKIEEQTDSTKLQYGQRIMQEHKNFEFHLIDQRKSQTAAFKIDYVCDNIRHLKNEEFVHFTEKEKAAILGLYGQYQKEYEEHKQSYVKSIL